MKTALAALAGLLLLSAPVLADDDCRAPLRDWVEIAEARDRIARDWDLAVDRIKIDDGCYEVHTVDAAGNRVKIKFDPARLEPVAIKVVFDDPSIARRWLEALRHPQGAAPASHDSD